MSLLSGAWRRGGGGSAANTREPSEKMPNENGVEPQSIPGMFYLWPCPFFP